MEFISYEDARKNGSLICERCKEILDLNNGKIAIQGLDKMYEIIPSMWKHSLRDKYHALFYMGYRHIFLCRTDVFDQISLKRIRPIRRDDDDMWTVSIDGEIYHIVEVEGGGYEILNDDGTIVKNEVIEALIFNHMMNLK